MLVPPCPFASVTKTSVSPSITECTLLKNERRRSLFRAIFDFPPTCGKLKITESNTPQPFGRVASRLVASIPWKTQPPNEILSSNKSIQHRHYKPDCLMAWIASAAVGYRAWICSNESYDVAVIIFAFSNEQESDKEKEKSPSPRTRILFVFKSSMFIITNTWVSWKTYTPLQK